MAWKYGVERQDGPTALILSPSEPGAAGSYRRAASEHRPRWLCAEGLRRTARAGIFIATGSEVELAVAAWDKLTAEGVKARVVSMPSTDAFDKQDAAYRESVLPKAVSARVAVEAGIADYWFKYVGLNGAISSDHLPVNLLRQEQLFEEFGFTVENVVAKAKELL